MRERERERERAREPCFLCLPSQDPSWGIEVGVKLVDQCTGGFSEGSGDFREGGFRKARMEPLLNSWSSFHEAVAELVPGGKLGFAKGSDGCC